MEWNWNHKVQEDFSLHLFNNTQTLRNSRKTLPSITLAGPLKVQFKEFKRVHSWL